MLQVLDETKIIQASILDKATEILRRGWCKGYMARDEYGHAVEIESPYARSFCFFGALHRASLELGYPTNPHSSYCDLVKTIHELEPEMVGFNDSLAHNVEEVVNKIREFKNTVIQA